MRDEGLVVRNIDTGNARGDVGGGVTKQPTSAGAYATAAMAVQVAYTMMLGLHPMSTDLYIR